MRVVTGQSSDREQRFLRTLRDLCHLFASERDATRLPPLVLDAAIELTEAERGFLVKVEGKKPDGGWRFKVEVARGFDKVALKAAQAHFSKTVVRRVVERGAGLVTTRDGGDDGDVLQLSSVAGKRIVAIVCVPLVLRGETRGVLYLDHRFVADAFHEADLPMLQTFADQAALALETVELLTRAAGPAEPAPLMAQAPATRPASDAVHTALPQRLRLGGLVGQAPGMQRLYADIERAARSWDPVLVAGEPGTGKELAARELHARGPFPRQPFVVVPCDAAPNLEQELASGNLLKSALRGTLYLDGVEALTPGAQRALLTALDLAREGDARKAAGARVVASSTRDLRPLVELGALRADLFYRLDVLRLSVPALRERPGDVPLLVAALAERAGRIPAPRLSPNAERLLGAYAWPGNVRELENEVRRWVAANLVEVSSTHLSPEVREGRGVARAEGTTSGKTIDEVERAMVVAALEACGGNKARAARQLDIPRTTLYRLLERWGL